MNNMKIRHCDVLIVSGKEQRMLFSILCLDLNIIFFLHYIVNKIVLDSRPYLTTLGRNVASCGKKHRISISKAMTQT